MRGSDSDRRGARGQVGGFGDPTVMGAGPGARSGALGTRQRQAQCLGQVRGRWGLGDHTGTDPPILHPNMVGIYATPGRCTSLQC